MPLSPRMLWRLCSLLASLTCSCTKPGPAGQGASPDPGAPARDLVAERPYVAKVPRGYDPARPAPLILSLHGLGDSGAPAARSFGLLDLADTEGVLVAYPDGTPDRRGLRFWNATDACCDLDHWGPDDVAYLTAVLDDMGRRYQVDPGRVYVFGYSNGGFMAHRLACERAPRIAAIVALAGDGWLAPARCQPSRPVAVLHLHGDADEVVHYQGGNLGTLVPPDQAPLLTDYPAARESTLSWARRNGCVPAPEPGAPLDLVGDLPGSETLVDRWRGCKPGGAVELWTIRGGSHRLRFQPPLAGRIWGFLSAQHKP